MDGRHPDLALAPSPDIPRPFEKVTLALPLGHARHGRLLFPYSLRSASTPSGTGVTQYRVSL